MCIETSPDFPGYRDVGRNMAPLRLPVQPVSGWMLSSDDCFLTLHFPENFAGPVEDHVGLTF